MKNFSNVTAAILAGGLGTRLRSVLEGRPKVLAEVRSRPFLEYLLDQLIYWEIKSVVLCTGFMGSQIESYFGDSYRSLRLFYSREKSPLGTAGALRFALPLFQSDTILVLNGDSYCKADLRPFWSWHCQQGAEVSLLLIENPDTKRYGKVEVDEKGRILKFEEKNYKGGEGWINAGIYLLGKRFLHSIPDRYPISLERELFPSWIGAGLYGYKSTGQFLDIGTPESYGLAEDFFAEDILK